MTVIAAAYDARTGSAAMAADGMSTRDELVLRTPGKIQRRGLALVGISVVRYWHRPVSLHPPLEEGQDVEAWCWGLADALCAWGRERGHGDQHDGMLAMPMHLVIASPAGLFNIACTGEVSFIQEAFTAIGSGTSLAMGAMAAAVRMGVEHPSDRVRMGVEVACDLNPYCGKPVQVEEVTGDALPKR